MQILDRSKQRFHMRNQVIIYLGEVSQHHLAPIDKAVKRLRIGAQLLVSIV